MDGKSLDITQERLNQLKNLFPEILTEGKINLDKLKEFLNDDIQDKKEFYQLNWAGKNQARKEIQKQTSATLRKITNNKQNHTQKPHTFIEGENLEVLRILQKSYFNKIKMIYIDPPYNTGNDSFVYPDDYTENKQDYQIRAGIKDDNGNLLQDTIFQKNTKENGQFHSVWLSMMYPRLFLARNLLTEDGVIFISIDDNEASNLKLLCDEVFGEENFVANMVRQNKAGSGHDSSNIAIEYDYILVYCKDKIILNLNKEVLDTENDKKYKFQDEYLNERGLYYLRDLDYKGSYSKSMDYAIKTPDGKEIFAGNVFGYPNTWRWSKIKFEWGLENGFIVFKKNDGNWKVYIKQYQFVDNEGLLKERKLPFRSLVKFLNGVGTQEISSLFGNSALFSFPKSSEMLKHLLKIATNPTKNDLILDFFAGSGTTAQAVMELNEEDGGDRRFICVQLPEPLDGKSEAYKAGYKTIADITKARIEKVIAKISKEREGKIAFADKALPIFEHYRLGESNFKVWQSEFESTEQLLEQLDIFQDSKKTESTPENMLVELLLKSGFGFDATITTIATSSHQNIYVVAGKGLWIYFGLYDEFFYEQITTSNLQRLIILDSCFGDDTSLKNFELDLKERKIDLIII